MQEVDKNKKNKKLGRMDPGQTGTRVKVNQGQRTSDSINV